MSTRVIRYNSNVMKLYIHKFIIINSKNLKLRNITVYIDDVKAINI